MLVSSLISLLTARICPFTSRLRDGSGRVGFWKILPDPLGFGSRRVRALGKPVPLGLGRVEPENPTELTGDDDEVESKNFHIL